MKLKLNLLAICLIIASFWGYANSMHCWKCKSSTNNNCGQYFIPDNIQSEDCEQQFRTNLASRSQIIRGCMRIIQKNGSVIRSCFFGKDSSKDKCNRILNEDGSSIENVINCDICAENYCNNSPSFTTNSILVLTTGLAIFLSLLYTI
ncbi:uncharacterized protein LOC129608472 isoform X2 [Condylostylus longicornis]|uniref:uncharacterized protein LOC129608472 isoform X2 n=1 Tax=Condylostylus longicornis TaxID=2530218 RepID=UPI00244E1E3A|nr:uncharacterized protein LOC129608472 isoform X2 [Condylostylus longicornis]